VRTQRQTTRQQAARSAARHGPRRPRRPRRPAAPPARLPAPPAAPSRRRPRPALRAVAALALALTLVVPALHGARAGRAWSGAPYPLDSLEVVLQAQRNDCGPAVVATLLAWAGTPAPLAQVTAAARLGPDGLTLGEFARLARSFGLTGGWYHASAGRLASLPGPFVAHLSAAGSGAPQLGHLVVVWAAGNGAVLVSDPAAGPHAMSLAAFARRFTGRVYLLEDPA